MPAFGVDVGAGINEHLDGALVSVPGAGAERSLAISALDVVVCACFKEPSDDVGVPFSSGLGPMSMHAGVTGAPSALSIGLRFVLLQWIYLRRRSR